MLYFTGDDNSAYQGADFQFIYEPESYDIDGTWAYTSKIFSPDDRVTEIETFSCSVESVDMSGVDPERTDTVNVVLISLSQGQTAGIAVGKYIFDVKEVSPTGFIAYPITLSHLEVKEPLT
jgi:hypothetical protein